MEIIRYLNYAVSGLAILTMLLCVIQGAAFFRRVPGGRLKRRAGILLALLAFFFLGYIASPFLYLLEHFEYTTLVVYLVFFFGALFVMLALNTILVVLKFFGVVEKREP